MERPLGSDPDIVNYGRTRVDQYPVDEYQAALERAFKNGGADYIVLDSNPRGQGFTSAAVAWGVDSGLLYNDLSVDDTQSEVSSFRLTQKGTKVIIGGEPLKAEVPLLSVSEE